jgi:hypothetical protein
MDNIKRDKWVEVSEDEFHKNYIYKEFLEVDWQKEANERLREI